MKIGQSLEFDDWKHAETEYEKRTSKEVNHNRLDMSDEWLIISHIT
jgi:hypothetical protein